LLRLRENGAKDNAELGALLAVLNALDASLLIRDDRSPL
jgi:hypothetical protein